MTKKILLVDDEPNVLQGYKRHLRKAYDLELAVGGDAALAALKEKGPFAVVISDMQMPEMSGVELLAKVRDKYEHTVRIMLTGNADQGTAAEAVNEGSIFRFLNKPCSPEELARSIDAALEHHRLITAEAELLSQTLSGSVRMLTQVLSLAMPEAFGLTQEARTLARRVADQMEVGPSWQIEMAAMLMRVGCVSLPADVRLRYLRKEELSDKEAALIEQTPKVGHDLVASIPRLEQVAKIIAGQFESPGESTLVASQILHVVGDFQRIRGGGSPLPALRQMEVCKKYNREIVGHLADVVSDLYESREVSVSDLREGMILEACIEDGSGRILVASGTEVHESLIQKLTMLRRSGTGVREPIQVRSINQAPPVTPSRPVAALAC